MSQAADLSIRAFARNAWIVAGLLLLGIGLGDLSVGRSKLQQYNETLSRPMPEVPRDPAILFPKATEAEEQRAVAYAKLGFYRLLFKAGQYLTLTGFVLLIVGAIQLRPKPEKLLDAR